MSSYSIFLVTFFNAFIIALSGNSQNALPVLNNVIVRVDSNSQLLTVTYDIADKDDKLIFINLYILNNADKRYSLSTKNATGDVNKKVAVGKGRKIYWQFPISFKKENLKEIYVRLLADDNRTFDVKNILDNIDTNRLIKNFKSIYMVRNRKNAIGLSGVKKTQDVIINDFKNNSTNIIQKQDVAHENYTGQNIISRKSGLDSSSKLIVICANYDGVADTPETFAASGIVALIEINRILNQFNFKHDIVFVAFDLEREESAGSTAFVFDGGLLENENIIGAIYIAGAGQCTSSPNTQVVPEGYETLFPDAFNYVTKNNNRGDFILDVYNEQSVTLHNSFISNIRKVHPQLKSVSINTPNNGKLTPELAGDHLSFWYNKYPAIEITDGGLSRNSIPNLPGFRLEKINFLFMKQVITAISSTVMDLAEIQHITLADVKLIK